MANYGRMMIWHTEWSKDLALHIYPEGYQPETPRAQAKSRWRDRQGIADHFGVSVRCISNWQRRRRIPYVKVGRNVRFDVDACDEAVKAMEIKSAALLAQGR